MEKYKKHIVIINLFLLIVFINFSVYNKEDVISNGKLILVKLDSLEDAKNLSKENYKQIKYDIGEIKNFNSIPRKGYCVFINDSNGIAQKERFQESTTPLSSKEFIIEYFILNSGNIKLVINSYFIKNIDSLTFKNPIYGGLKVDNNGNSILVGLYNNDLKEIK